MAQLVERCNNNPKFFFKSHPSRSFRTATIHRCLGVILTLKRFKDLIYSVDGAGSQKKHWSILLTAARSHRSATRKRSWLKELKEVALRVQDFLWRVNVWNLVCTYVNHLCSHPVQCLYSLNTQYLALFRVWMNEWTENLFQVDNFKTALKL